MAKIKILSRKDLYDILYGCTILGTGGGGELKEGISLIEKALNAGREFKLACMDEVSEDSIIACPYMCGSISPPTEEDEKKYANLPRIEEVPPLVAYNALEQFIGKRKMCIRDRATGGFIDELIMRITDMFLSFPPLLLAIAISAFLLSLIHI